MKRLLLVFMLLFPTFAFAWNPPETVTVYIGYAPGSGNEVSIRKLAAIISEKYPKTTFVVKNMPGGDGLVATKSFIRQPADGSSITIPSYMSHYVTNEIWQKQLKDYQWDDVTNVMSLGKSPLVIVAGKQSKIRTSEQFVKYIKTTDHRINFALGGGAHRTTYEYIIETLKADRNLIKPIMFNGPQPAVESAAKYDGTGTEFGIMPIAIANPLIQAGFVVPIAFTGERTMPQYPDVPLLSKVLPGANVYAGWSLVLQKGTSKEVVDWYQKEFKEAVLSKAYRDWCFQNIVFIDESELETENLLKTVKQLRETYLPILEKLDLSKEGQ